MSQQDANRLVSGYFDLAIRPARMFAPFMLAGSVGFAIAAVWLLAHSWVGLVIFAESPPGTTITMPAVTTEDLTVYAVMAPGQPYPDVECKLATTSDSWVQMNFDSVNPTSNGRVLKPVKTVFDGWHAGDTLTCTGANIKTLVYGHNAGLDYLLQGLMFAFVALGSGLIALIGFASRRHRARAMAAQSGGPPQTL